MEEHLQTASQMNEPANNFTVPGYNMHQPVQQAPMLLIRNSDYFGQLSSFLNHGNFN